MKNLKKPLTVLTFGTSKIDRTLTFLIADTIATVYTWWVTYWFTVRNNRPFYFSRCPSAVFTEHICHGRRIRELVSFDTADRTHSGITFGN